MLPLRARKIARTCRRYVRHNSSASAVSYPKQVRAYPFAFDRKEAARRASLAAILARPTEILRCLRSYFLGTKPVQPSRAAAAYLPGWIIDADIEAQRTSQNAEGEAKPRAILAQFKNSYMPGFVFDPLTHMSFKDYKDSGDLPQDTVPWSPELEKQHNMDIACLPFTMTPFSLVNAARTRHNLKQLPGIRYDPKTLKETFLAVYPVLMPVYLLQYEAHWSPGDEKDPKLVSVIVDASTTSKGRVAVENIMSDFAAFGPSSMKGIMNAFKSFPLLQFDRGKIMTTIIPNWVKLDRLLVAPADATRNKSIQLSLDFLALPRDAWARYQQYDIKVRKEATGSEDIDWNDLRIREYSKAETEIIDIYREVRAEHFTLREMVSTLSKINHEITTLSIDGSRSKSAVDSRKPTLQTMSPQQLSTKCVEQFKRLLELLQRAKPGWVGAWETQHKEEAENDSELSKEEREAKAELIQEAQAKAKEQAERTAQETIHENVPGQNDPEPRK